MALAKIFGEQYLGQLKASFRQKVCAPVWVKIWQLNAGIKDYLMDKVSI